MGTVENHGNTEITETVIFVKGRDFAKMPCFAVFFAEMPWFYVFLQEYVVFKPPPPVGAGGGYMFLGRPSVPPSVRASVRASMIHVVVLCFRDISSMC